MVHRIACALAWSMRGGALILACLLAASCHDPLSDYNDYAARTEDQHSPPPLPTGDADLHAPLFAPDAGFMDTYFESCLSGNALPLGPRRTSVSLAMPDEDIKAELERLRAENERLKGEKKSGRPVSLKVSEKGGVSVYGLGRFPVTLYKEQWAKLLDMADEIREFIKENESKLKTKGE